MFTPKGNRITSLNVMMERPETGEKFTITNHFIIDLGTGEGHSGNEKGQVFDGLVPNALRSLEPSSARHREDWKRVGRHPLPVFSWTGAHRRHGVGPVTIDYRRQLGVKQRRNSIAANPRMDRMRTLPETAKCHYFGKVNLYRASRPVISSHRSTPLAGRFFPRGPIPSRPITSSFRADSGQIVDTPLGPAGKSPYRSA